MYNSVEIGQVLDFEMYKITTKLGMIYAYTIEYFDLLFSNKDKRLLAANSRSPQTIVDQTCVCEEVLNNFAL